MNKFRILVLVLVVLFLGFNQFAYSQNAPRALVQQLIKDEDLNEFIQSEGLSVNEVMNRLTSKKVDLNGDKTPEYIVSGLLCGNANCPYWIYQKSGNGYAQIPNGDIEGESVTLRQTKTNGYLDLAVEYHGGGGYNGLYIYKYDGSKYAIKECFKKDYGYTDGSGNYHEYKTPKITKRSCN